MSSGRGSPWGHAGQESDTPSQTTSWVTNEAPQRRGRQRAPTPRRRSPAAARGRDRAGLPGSPASSRRCGSSPRTGAFPGGCGAGRWSRPCYGAARRSLVTAVAKGAAPGRHQRAPPLATAVARRATADVISARRPPPGSPARALGRLAQAPPRRAPLGLDTDSTSGAGRHPRGGGRRVLLPAPPSRLGAGVEFCGPAPPRLSGPQFPHL